MVLARATVQGEGSSCAHPHLAEKRTKQNAFRKKKKKKDPEMLWGMFPRLSSHEPGTAMGSTWAEPVTATAGPLAVTSVHTSCPMFPSHMSHLSPIPAQERVPGVHPSHTHCPTSLGTPGHPAHAVGTGQTQAGPGGCPGACTASSYFIKLELDFGALLTPVCAPLVPACSGE